MVGSILQVSVSAGGIPKRPIPLGRVRFRGFEGDSWANTLYHGGADQSVLLIASEVLERLAQAGYPVFPGALGENLTTRGLDVSRWRIGQVYRAGTARLRFTKVRVPCRTIKIYGQDIGRSIFDARVRSGDYESAVWAYSGMYAAVLAEGAVCPGDRIELESETA